MTPGAAADQAAQQKMSKYASYTSTHVHLLSNSHWNGRNMGQHLYASVTKQYN